MLCQFTFENFKSFKDEATLDLFAEKIREHEDSLIMDCHDGEALLPVVSIYGPNGGGKTSVLEAFIYLSHKVLMPVVALRASETSLDEDLEKGKMNEFKNFSVEEQEKYHLFDSTCKDLPVKFDVLFRIDEREYRYQLNLLHNAVVEENLYSRNLVSGELEVLFERNMSDQYIGDTLGEVKVGNLKTTMPMLSHLAINYDLGEINQIKTWFMQCRILDYDNPFQDKRIVFLKDKAKEDIFLKMLAEMDINISKIRTEEDSTGKITSVYTSHCLADGICGEIPFAEESSGTRKLFGLLPFLLECLHSGSLVIADEMAR